MLFAKQRALDALFSQIIFGHVKRADLNSELYSSLWSIFPLSFPNSSTQSEIDCIGTESAINKNDF